MIYRIGRTDVGLEGKFLFRTLPLPVLLALAPCVSAFLRRAARGLPADTTGSPNGGAGSRRCPKTAFGMPIRRGSLIVLLPVLGKPHTC
jgi:hypothetical protein